MFFTPLCQLNDAKVLCNKTKKQALAFMCVHLRCVFGFTPHSGEKVHSICLQTHWRCMLFEAGENPGFLSLLGKNC